MRRLSARVLGTVVMLLGVCAAPLSVSAATTTQPAAYCAQYAAQPATLTAITTTSTHAFVYAAYLKARTALSGFIKMTEWAKSGTFQVQPGEAHADWQALTDAGNVTMDELRVWEHQNLRRSSTTIAAINSYVAKSRVALIAYATDVSAMRPLIAATCSTGSTTTVPTTTVPTTQVPIAVIANADGIGLNTAVVRWSVSGLPGVSRVYFYTFKGTGCATRAHSASTAYDPASNTASGTVVSTGLHFYSPEGPYSGYVVIASTSGTTQSGCINLGRS